MKILAVIPSRYASTRLPAKPLIPISGKPLLAHVYDAVKDCPLLSKVVVATDDERIMDLARKIGATGVMTSRDHQTGTDRIAEVAKNFREFDIILNIQGDVLKLDHTVVESLCAPLVNHDNIPMSTLKKEIANSKDLDNPNVVKVAADLNNFALYFSRYPIPFERNEGGGAKKYQHIGLYGFRREFLLKLGSLKQTPLEKSELLEQLRVLENGEKIYVNEIQTDIHEINTQEDILAFEAL